MMQASPGDDENNQKLLLMLHGACFTFSRKESREASGRRRLFYLILDRDEQCVEKCCNLLYNNIMNETSNRKLDLFKIADQNAKRIEDQFKEIKRKYRDEDKTVLEAFLDFVEKCWCISINLKQSEVNG
jgi:hypothetical protein